MSTYYVSSSSTLFAVISPRGGRLFIISEILKALNVCLVSCGKTGASITSMFPCVTCCIIKDMEYLLIVLCFDPGLAFALFLA